jgi:hypothetical protein
VVEGLIEVFDLMPGTMLEDAVPVEDVSMETVFLRAMPVADMSFILNSVLFTIRRWRNLLIPSKLRKSVKFSRDQGLWPVRSRILSAIAFPVCFIKNTIKYMDL